MPPTRVAKKGKRKDERPARKRYWAGRTLEKHKVHNLMKHCGMSEEYALSFWKYGKPSKKDKDRIIGFRQGRVPDGFFRRI